MDGLGSPHVFSEPLCKGPVWFPNIFFFIVQLATLVSVNHPTVLTAGVSLFRVYQEVLDGTAFFEIHFNTMFPADVLVAFTHAFNMGNHYVGLVVLEACVVPSVNEILVASLFFFCLILALFKAHTGYVHLSSACLRWPSSSLSYWLLEQIDFGLCLRVLMTLNLAARWWWLSHCKYKSVCVDFLYTDVRENYQTVASLRYPRWGRTNLLLHLLL